jgi:CBS-domain-containing membrane protein
MHDAKTVGDVMRREFVSLRLGDRLDFVEDVMRLGRIRHLPVLEDDRLVGIVSQRDLLANSLTRALEFDAPERRTFLRSVDVAEAMSREVVTVTRETPLAEAARLLLRHRIGCLPVVSEAGVPVGLVTESDLLRAAYLEGEDED